MSPLEVSVTHALLFIPTTTTTFLSRWDRPLAVHLSHSHFYLMTFCSFFFFFILSIYLFGLPWCFRW